MSLNLLKHLTDQVFKIVERLEGAIIKNPEDLQAIRDNMAETLRLLSRNTLASEHEVTTLVADLIKNHHGDDILQISKEKVETARFLSQNVTQMLHILCGDSVNPVIERNIADSIVANINAKNNMNEVLKTLWLYTRRTEQLGQILKKSASLKKLKQDSSIRESHVQSLQDPWTKPLEKFQENFITLLDYLLQTDALKYEKPLQYFKKSLVPDYVIPKFPKESFQTSAGSSATILPKRALTSFAQTKSTANVEQSVQALSVYEMVAYRNDLKARQDLLQENLAIFDDIRAEGESILEEKNNLLESRSKSDNATHKHLKTPEEVINLIRGTHPREEAVILLKTIETLLNSESAPTEEEITRALQQSLNLSEKLFHRAEQMEEALKELQTEIAILSASFKKEDMDYTL